MHFQEKIFNLLNSSSKLILIRHVIDPVSFGYDVNISYKCKKKRKKKDGL